MASTKRINVLIYSGPGTSLTSVRHATWSLRRLLGSRYAVVPVTGDQIIKEPWSASCALLVMPGGADVGYCRVLNGEGNRRIKQYVQLGGTYLGFCAGGYYGSSKCEFEVGRKGMEVIGDRELGFFPGICRGLAFDGFVYQSEAGAKAVSVKPNDEAFPGRALETFRSYYNGGGAFVEPENFKDQGVEILASYTEDLHVDVGPSKAAIVYRKIGQGAAIVTGPHPEFSGANLNREEPSNPNYPSLVDALVADEKSRTAFLKACLSKLGLQVSQELEAVPSLSHLHLSASQPSLIAQLLASWRESKILIPSPDDDEGEGSGVEFIRGENDTFRLSSNPSPPLPSNPPNSLTDPPSSSDRLLPQDYNSAIKTLHPHTRSHPPPALTPSFSHDLFFSSLSRNSKFGSHILYGEVVTSTTTLLEKNPSLLASLPTGFVATATTQVAGRGRGSNVWVSPPGSLMFSLLLRHGVDGKAGVVFVQYVAALAIVKAIKGYEGKDGERRCGGLGVRLKWPNDIYAEDPNGGGREGGGGGAGRGGGGAGTAGKNEGWVKIGGILVTSSYSGGEYTLLVGIGLNVSSSAPGPTAGLDQVASAAGIDTPFELERLLAGILAEFEGLYGEFCGRGWDRGFEEMYRDCWLHEGQIVTLEMEGGAKARIQGITRDWGMLVAEEVEGEEGKERGTGRRWELRSDANSFDFFKGLVKAKK